MARKPELHPAWLVGLLVEWGRRERSATIQGLGFYRVNPMLKAGIPQQARSYEPTGYSDNDLEEIGNCIRKLERLQIFAVMRYAIPERVQAIDNEIKLSSTTWFEILRTSLLQLSNMVEKKLVA